MKPSNILTRVNVRLYSDDLDYLRRQFPDNYNAQLRRIIARWVALQSQKDRTK
jgi:hypothetical protein